MRKHSIRWAILLAFFSIGISINSTVYGGSTSPLHSTSETISAQASDNTLGQEPPHIPDEVERMAAQGGVRVIINLRESDTAPNATQAQMLHTMRQTQSLIVQTLSTTDFQLSQRFTRLPVIVGTITEDGLAALRDNPLIASVTPDYPMIAHVQNGVEAVEADKVHSGEAVGMPITGDGVVVAVMDTGIDDHPDLAGKILETECFTVPGCSTEDTDGHGTHVAGIIASDKGYAPDSELIILKVLESVHSGHTSDWLEALDWLLTNHEDYNIKVVNMSLGTQALFSAQCDVEFAGAATAIRTLREQGVILISSTGNDSDNGAIAAPGCLTDILSVAAVYDNGVIAPSTCPTDTVKTKGIITCFSNTNWMTDIAAPGAEIESTYLGGGYAYYSGTSQASPAVAGTIALMLEANVNLPPAKIQSILQDTGSNDPAYKTNDQTPLPRLNALEAVKSAISTKFVCADVIGIPETECKQLRKLYTLRDPIEPWEIHEGWELTYTPCDWFGIVCQDNHVTGIRLNQNNLVGLLKDVEWDAFPALVELRLANNNLNGPIPTTLADLENLSILELGYNRLDIWEDNPGSLIADERDPSWHLTQTVPPINVGSFLTSTKQFSIMFSPIPYQDDGGYYLAGCGTSPGVYTFTGRTTDKKGAIINFNQADETVVQPNTTYYCTVRTYTELSTLWSEPSVEITVSTDPNAVGRNPTWTLIPTADTTVSSNRNAPFYMGNFRGLMVGSYTDYTVNPPLAFNRSVALMDFIDTIPVPPGARVKKITLRVYYYGTNGKQVNVEVYRVGPDWNETSPINHPPLLLGRSGGSTAYGNKKFPVVGLNPQWIDIELHSDLIHDLTVLNHGLALRSNPQNAPGLVMCAGSYTENLGSSLCSTTPPKLLIEYELRPELVNPFPADDAIDQPLTVPLSWEVRPDGSGNTMRYDIQMRLGSDPGAKFVSVVSNLRQNRYDLKLTEPGEYLWRVVVRSGSDPASITIGEEWSFHTNYCHGNIPIPQTECDALRALYKSTSGLETTTWLKKPKICDWGDVDDIECKDGSVTAIDLTEKLVGGELPPEIGNFPNLQTLTLRGNNQDGLGGHIPPEIRNLTNLIRLDLHGHQFSGRIPDEITQLKLVEHVDLSSNDLTKSIPAGIEDMEALTYLNLSDNRLSEGIPASIGNLESLTYLNLSRNRLGQELPDELAYVTTLTELYLEYNRIVGVIPPSIIDLNKLKFLNLRYNRLGTDNQATAHFVKTHEPPIPGNLKWQETQTVPPTNFDIIGKGENHVVLVWDYDGDTENAGVFQVLCGDSEGGPYLDRAQTTDKLKKTLTIDKLFPGGTYYCIAITHTLEHTEQKSAMWSEPSDVLTVTTDPGPPISSNPVDLDDEWDGEQPYIRFLNMAGAPTQPAIGSKCDTGGGGRIILSSGHSGIFRVKTESENIATTLAVYKGKYPSGLEHKCNENADAMTGPDPAVSAAFALPQVAFDPQWRAIVDFVVEPGETFYIVIFNRNSGHGHVKLTLQDASFILCDDALGILPEDCESLVDLYYATQGYRWYNNTGWLLSNTPCESWFGVICNDNERVVRLNLAYNNLDGRIPDSIGDLTRLRKLLLNDNKLRGSIPHSIENLTRLNELRLGFNALTAVGESLIKYLNDESPRWDITQTIAPSNIQAQCVSRNAVNLSWSDIKYIDADGYYEIAYSEFPGGPYDVVHFTADRDTNHFTISGLRPKTPYYFVMRTYTDTDDGKIIDLWSNRGSEVALSPTCEDTVVRLVLIDPADGKAIRTLKDGDIIDLSLLGGREINIRADVNFTTIGSVVFDLNQGWEKTTENSAPYALFGDNNGNFNGRDLGLGVYTLTAQPFTLPNGHGEAGIPKTITFTLTDGDTLYRVNAGGPRVVTNGKVWDADKHFLDGYEWPHPTAVDISETTEDAPYLTKRSTDTDFGAFSYEFPVPNGNYDVILHFAEIYFTGEAGQGSAETGERVFDVSIEDQLVLNDFDMLALKPPLTAFTRSFEDVVVTDGLLTLRFHDPVADRPSISAIEIVIPDNVVEIDPSIPTPTPVPDRPNALIYNGGFELSTTIEGEPAYWDLVVSRFSRRMCTNNPHSGNCALRMRSENGTPTLVIQRNDDIDPVFQNIGDQLVFSAWVRGQNLTADVRMTAFITYDSGTTVPIDLDTSGLSGTINPYQELTASTTLTEPIQRVRIRLVVRQGTGTLFVDDVKLQLEPPSVLPVLPSEPDGLRGIRMPGQ